jgi:hypothetical protein
LRTGAFLRRTRVQRVRTAPGPAEGCCARTGTRQGAPRLLIGRLNGNRWPGRGARSERADTTGPKHDAGRDGEKRGRFHPRYVTNNDQARQSHIHLSAAGAVATFSA